MRTKDHIERLLRVKNRKYNLSEEEMNPDHLLSFAIENENIAKSVGPLDMAYSHFCTLMHDFLEMAHLVEELESIKKEEQGE